MILTTTLDKILLEIDKKNSRDKRQQPCGTAEELFYGQKMTEMLNEFFPQACQELQIACRGQHIERWRYPRSNYPMGRNGYLKWRRELYKIHSGLIQDILHNFEVDDIDFIKKVGNIIAKKKIKLNPDSQRLEDVACLVFLKFYFDNFIVKTNDNKKIVAIVQKTWQKMSEDAQAFALKITYSTKTLELIEKALA